MFSQQSTPISVHPDFYLWFHYTLVEFQVIFSSRTYYLFIGDPSGMSISDEAYLSSMGHLSDISVSDQTWWSPKAGSPIRNDGLRWVFNGSSKVIIFLWTRKPVKKRVKKHNFLWTCFLGTKLGQIAGLEGKNQKKVYISWHIIPIVYPYLLEVL